MRNPFGIAQVVQPHRLCPAIIAIAQDCGWKFGSTHGIANLFAKASDLAVGTVGGGGRLQIHGSAVKRAKQKGKHGRFSRRILGVC